MKRFLKCPHSLSSRYHTHHRILHYSQINICLVVKKYDLFNQWKPYEAGTGERADLENEKVLGSCKSHVGLQTIKHDKAVCARLASKNRYVPHSCFLPNRENAPARMCIFLLLLNSTRLLVFGEFFFFVLFFFPSSLEQTMHKGINENILQLFSVSFLLLVFFFRFLQQFNFSPLFTISHPRL